jgi:hypothetical protein
MGLGSGVAVGITVAVGVGVGVTVDVGVMVLDDSTVVEIDLPVYVTVWADPVRLRQILPGTQNRYSDLF